MRGRRVGAALALAPLLLMAGCSGGDGPGSADSFVVGDCLELVDGAGEEAGSLTGVPCDQPHAGEVVLATPGFFAEDEELPAEDRLQAIADVACEDAMVGYSGQPATEAGVRMSYLYPTEASWGDGDRGLTCIAVNVDPETGGIGQTESALAQT